jgi:hypothetical protein
MKEKKNSQNSASADSVTPWFYMVYMVYMIRLNVHLFERVLTSGWPNSAMPIPEEY